MFIPISISISISLSLGRGVSKKCLARLSRDRHPWCPAPEALCVHTSWKDAPQSRAGNKDDTNLGLWMLRKWGSTDIVTLSSWASSNSRYHPLAMGAATVDLLVARTFPSLGHRCCHS